MLSNTLDIQASSQLNGSIVFYLSDLDAVQNNPKAEENILNAIGLTMSFVVGLPARYVFVRFVGSRRLRGATRQLNTGTLEVEYNIVVPVDSVAEFPDVFAMEEYLNSMDVSLFTSLLQENVDSNFGEGVLTVFVLIIEAVVVGVANDPLTGSGSQQAQIPLAFIVITLGSCLGVAIAGWILRTMLRLHRRRLQALPMLPEGVDVGFDLDELSADEKVGRLVMARLPPSDGEAATVPTSAPGLFPAFRREGGDCLGQGSDDVKSISDRDFATFQDQMDTTHTNKSSDSSRQKPTRCSRTNSPSRPDVSMRRTSSPQRALRRLEDSVPRTPIISPTPDPLQRLRSPRRMCAWRRRSGARHVPATRLDSDDMELFDDVELFRVI
jgi:hypothetical protein